MVAGTPDETVFERMLTGNMTDLVEEHFTSADMRAAFIDAHDAGDTAAPGNILPIAYLKANMLRDPHKIGIPKRGMGTIAQAMVKAAREHGEIYGRIPRLNKSGKGVDIGRRID